MLPAKQAAWEIEQRLLEDASAVERVLHERFLNARRRVKGPLALVGEYTMMPNPAAARIVAPSDHAVLWDWASRMIATGGRSSRDLSLANGAAVIEACEPVRDGAAWWAPSGPSSRIPRRQEGTAASSSSDRRRSAGAVHRDRTQCGRPRRRRADEPGGGGGCSPHTVDAHRHIFRARHPFRGARTPRDRAQPAVPAVS